MELWNIANVIQSNKEKEKGYNKGDVMAFFAELLSFCDEIRSVYLGTGSSSLYLVTEEKKKQYKEIDLSSEQLGEDVMGWFYDFKKSTATICKITVCNSDHYVEEEVAVYKKKQGSFTLNVSTEQDEERLKQIELALENSFLNGDSKQYFAEQIGRIRSVYANHRIAKSLWKRAEIFEYLNIYYDLLKFLMCENDFLGQKEVKDNVLMPLLQMGMVKDNKTKFRMTFQSPVILSIINVVYSRLNDYMKLQLHEGKTELFDTLIQSVEKDIYREIFLSKMNQIFRYYYVLYPEGDLYQTRVAVYDSRTEEGKMEIPIVSLSESECFQGIRELRLGEKILYELENVMDNSRFFLKDEYRIVLVGEIEKAPLEELIKYISDSLKRKRDYKNQEIIKIKFIVYTYSNMVSGKCCGYSYEFKKYIDFSTNSQKTKELLDEGEFIFFMDNCQLYDLGVEEIRDLILFKQSISIDTYEEYFKKEKNDGLNLNCKFMDLYNALVMYLWKGKFGTLRKSAKVSLMQYIKEYVNQSSEKAIYIYVSDINAFKELNCINEEFVRIEKYNQKEIGIIRFSTTEKARLPVKARCKEDSNRNVLVFNMWQFVKHILINQWEDMEKLYVDSKKYFLDDIYIGMDYTDWKSKVDIFYWFEGADDSKKEFIRQTIEILIEQLEYRKEPNMYQRYLKNAFVSFLYGAAKSVEDLIFLHIFKDYAELLRHYSIKGEDLDVKKHYNLNCKYSHKKNYWEAVELLDRNNVNMIAQYRVFDLDNSKEPGEEQSLLKKISQACLNIGYENSELYKRCEKYSL